MHSAFHILPLALPCNHCHLFLSPLSPLLSLSRYCPSCKNDSSEVIAAGEMRLSKKKANSVCKKSSSDRDWGRVSPKKIGSVIPNEADIESVN